MSRNRMSIAASPDEVFGVLSDPRSYGHFVVGTKRVRRFDPTWPAPGSVLHHTVGAGPLMLRDHSTVLSADPPERLVINAHIRPVAVLETVFTMVPTPGGTEVELLERPVSGPATMAWPPLYDWLLWLRNAESLRRLKTMAERRAQLAATGSLSVPAGANGRARD